MSRGKNLCIFIGNLGKDPETKFMPSGGAVTKFSLAIGSSFKDKNGIQQDHTEWVNFVCFNRLAEIAGEYLKKGSKVYIESKVRTNKWQDKDGNNRYTTEFVVNELQMLDSKSGSPEGQQQTRSESRPQVTQVQSGMDDAFDDDIPF